MKPFLILQLRPEADASDDEFAAICEKSGLTASDTVRVRLDCEDVPREVALGDVSGLIVGGGPGCISDAPTDKSPIEARIEAAVLALMPEVVARDIPFMGCCYGMGVLGHHLGAEVSKERFGEAVGTSTCAVQGRCHGPALKGLAARLGCFCWPQGGGSNLAPRRGAFGGLQGMSAANDPHRPKRLCYPISPGGRCQ